MGDPVVIGAVGGPFGVHGWAHVHSFTEPAENILVYEPWQLRRKVGWLPIAAQARAHRGGFIARVAGVEDCDAAVQLRGLSIGVDESVLPAADEDEYYWRELIGMTVTTLADEKLGTVERVFSTPAHDVLVVKDVVVKGAAKSAVEDANSERLLPFVRQVVAHVDANAAHIVVDWQSDWS